MLSSQAASSRSACIWKLLVEQHGAILHVVDVGTHLVHAVGGLDGHHVVDAGLAEAAVGQVDGLVAAVAQEDALGGHALHLGYLCLQLQLQRVGIAVQRCVVGVLVGIEKHVGLVAGIFVACTAVGCQRPDVRSY